MNRLTVTMAAALGLTLASSGMADTVRERSFTGPNGVTSNVQSSTARTGNSWTTTTTGTTSTGRSWSRQSTTTYDPETRVWTRSGGGSNSRGESWSSSGSGQCADGVCTRNGAFEGPRGNQVTTSGSSRRVEPGVWETRRSWSSSRGGSGEVRRTWRRVRPGG